MSLFNTTSFSVNCSNVQDMGPLYAEHFYKSKDVTIEDAKLMLLAAAALSDNPQEGVIVHPDTLDAFVELITSDPVWDVRIYLPVLSCDQKIVGYREVPLK